VVREFLLKTSLFPKVSAGAARALTGIDTSAEILDDITRRNYFTVRHTGPGGDTYQYHPLFREFLLKTAEGNYSPEALARLRTHAGEILIEAGQVSEGVELLISAQAWPLLAAQIQQQAQTQLANGRWQTLSRWLDVLPPPDVEANPWLLFWRANATMPRDLFAARADFHRAYLLFHEQNNPAGTYLAWSGAVDTFMYVWVDFAPLDYWIDEMEVLRREFPEYPSLDIEARVTCGMVGAAIWRRADRPMMREWADAGMSLLDKPIDPSIKLKTGYLLLLYLLWWQNNLRKSQMVFAKMHALGEDPQAGILARLMWKVMEATFLYMHGKGDEAIRAAHDGLVLAAEVGVHHLDLLLYAQSAYGYLTKFDMDGASLDMRGMESLLQSTHTFDFAHYHYLMTWILLGQNNPLMTLEHMLKGDEAVNRAGASNYPAFNAVTQAQALYECGRTMEAIAAVETAREWGKRLGSPFIEIHSQFLYALRGLDQHDPDECAAALTIALRLCKDNGYFVVPWFGWRKPLLIRLLHQALVFDIETDYVRSFIKQRGLAPPTDVPVADTWPFPLKLYTLGRFVVLLDDKPLSRSPGHKKPLELLQALVALGGREVDEDRLTETLWPEAEGDTARQNLKVNVHRLRKLLPDGAVTWSKGKLSLDARLAWVDLWALERELGRLDQSPPADAPAQTALVDRVFRLYRGEFLVESTAPWALKARERLRNKTLRLATRAAESLTQRDPAAAVPIYEKAIELDPLREPLYQGLMRCHQQLHQPAEGLRIYQRCRDTLQRDLGLSPALATETLHQSLKTGQ
jgi:LuxR family transcriptional regulator, maltose regulon positive regulatory protein